MENRRPVAARNVSLMTKMAKLCLEAGLAPNQISILSLVFSSIAAMFLLFSSYWQSQSSLFYVVAFLMIILKLLCNLFDGMVAIEYGKKTNSGELFNDAPDRFSDLLIFAACGIAVKDYPLGIHFGWLAASLAITTAYVRTLGKSIGAKVYFNGIMSKTKRFYILLPALVIDAILSKLNISFSTVYISLIIISIGSLMTCLTRLSCIYKELEDRHV